MKNWLVVANAARARVLEESGQISAARFVHVADLVHPQSRQKGIDLAGDRPGHMEGSADGYGSAEFPPRTDVREREQDKFAQQVAAVLNAGVADGRCAGLVLVASNPFLGRLSGHLSAQAHKRVLRTQPSDYTTLSDVDLAQRLDAS